MVRYYKENEAVLPHSHSSSNSFVRQAIKRAREERGRKGIEKGSSTIMFTNGRNEDESVKKERQKEKGREKKGSLSGSGFCTSTSSK